MRRSLRSLALIMASVAAHTAAQAQAPAPAPAPAPALPPLPGPVSPAQAAAAAAQSAPSTLTIRNMLTPSAQADKFGTYTAGGNEGLFQGGMGNASPQGTTRKAGCGPTSNDPECWAIISLQNGRALPSSWVPPGSPQLTGRNAVVADPPSILGFDPLDAAQVTTNVQCQTSTVTTPEVREERHCYDTTPDVPLNCSLGLEIEVDPDYIYQCMIVLATNSSVACSIGQVVTVDANTTYECVERMRSNQSNTCSVARTIEVDSNTQYVCVQELREAIDTTCSIGAVVEVRADTEYRCVEQVRTVANAGCTVGQLVTIDPRFQYECQANPNQVTTNLCARRLTVTCQVGSCGAQQISAPGLPLGVDFNVFNSWPSSNLSTVLLTFEEIGPELPGGYRYVEFQLLVQGTVEQPTQTLIGLTDIESYLVINGAVVNERTPGGFQWQPTFALQPGLNTLGFWFKYTQANEVPQVTIELRGNFCTDTVCSDEWDETECEPYRSRL